MHYGSGHIKASTFRKWGPWTVPHTPKAQLHRRGWSPGPVAPERMHGPGAKELPDVGPSGEAYELGNNRADESIEQSTNERARELSRNKKREGKSQRQPVKACRGMAYLLMKEALIDSSLYSNPLQTTAQGTFHLLRPAAWLSLWKWKQSNAAMLKSEPKVLRELDWWQTCVGC